MSLRRDECIIVEKVYNECTVCECPTYRFNGIQPPVSTIGTCSVRSVTQTGTIVEEDQVRVTVAFEVNVTFTDVDNQPRETGFRPFSLTRTVRLAGARPGMNVIVVPAQVQCLQARAVNDATAIEVDVGIWTVVKVTALVQLIVQAAFCPEPPECQEVAAFGCERWPEMCRDFYHNLFPPQPAPQASATEG